MERFLTLGNTSGIAGDILIELSETSLIVGKSLLIVIGNLYYNHQYLKLLDSLLSLLFLYFHLLFINLFLLNLLEIRFLITSLYIIDDFSFSRRTFII